MSTTIKIKRGLKDNLPSLEVGELGYCTDTDELFIGTSTGNTLLAGVGKSLEAPNLYAYGFDDFIIVVAEPNQTLEDTLVQVRIDEGNWSTTILTSTREAGAWIFPNLTPNQTYKIDARTVVTEFIPSISTTTVLAEDDIMVADALADNGLVVNTIIAQDFVFSGNLSILEYIAASETAMTAVAASEIALTAFLASETALTTVLASEIAMTAVAASETAMTAFLASEPATIALIASETAMTAVAASETAMNEIVTSQTAMNEIVASEPATIALIASETAMNAIVTSQIAMDAIVTSQIAMDEIVASETDMALIVASEIAMTSVAASEIAMTAVAASETALTTVFNSSTARTAMYNSAVAEKALRDNASAMSFIDNNFAESRSVGGNVNLYLTLQSGPLFCISADTGYVDSFSSRRIRYFVHFQDGIDSATMTYSNNGDSNVPQAAGRMFNSLEIVSYTSSASFSRTRTARVVIMT